MSTSRTKQTAGLALLVMAGTLIQGCASPGAAIDKEAQARAAAEQPAPPKPEEFPDPARANWKQGAFPAPKAFERVRPGMGKDPLRELLGWPHFSEGLWGVREWNYIFHFYNGKGSDYTTCQYMVRFNADNLATGAWWKDPECALLAQPPAATPIPASARLAPPQKLTLSADGLFRFDGAAATDLLPEGRARVERLAGELRHGFRALHYVVVTGHTDRLGGDAYNEALSLARANTVRDLLVQQGIERKLIRTAGMGKRQPVVSDCEGTRASPALLQCLQPNRRVEIDVAGEQ
ncbi:OmpA family protein [Variovorax sp.]|jgi:OmpA-OmpF porin, OOP family|uniref:OmpA family protein n=1 Tax=Variovorax sp. TaxID=1871043 RepID=UPI0025D57C52|nr:OmpA family protein [Variovorax sp.]